MPAATLSTPVVSPQMPSVDPLKASVRHLLSRAYTLPCSAAAQAFSQLVQPTSRFQLALDALLPLLDVPAQVSGAIRLHCCSDASHTRDQAGPANPCLFYFILTVCTTPDRH